jgi:hypothetical protein
MGAIGFAIGFGGTFLLEALLFWGVESAMGRQMQPVGLGWVIVPFIMGSACWHAGRQFVPWLLQRRR